MQVEALANSLHMLLPQESNEPEPWTMRNIYNSWTYHVQYWKNGSDEKVSAVNHAHCSWQLPVLCSAGAWLRSWWWRKFKQVAAPYGPEALRPGPLSSRSYPFWGWLVMLHHTSQGSRADFLGGLVQENKPSLPRVEIAGEGQLTQQLAGELGSPGIGWPVNDYCFMAWGPTYTTE